MSAAATPVPYQQEVSPSGGTVVVRVPSAAPSASYVLRSPTGASLGSGTASSSTITGGTKLTVTVPSGLAREEGYWVETVEADPVFFDVVARPLGRLSALGELEAVRSGIRDRLQTMADRSGITLAEQVELIAGQGRAWLQGKLMDRLVEVQAEYVPDAERLVGAARAPAYIRVNSLLNTVPIHQAEVHYAVASAYSATISPAQFDDVVSSDAGIHDHHMKKAGAILAQLGAARLDLDGDGSADARLSSPRSVVRWRRVPG